MRALLERLRLYLSMLRYGLAHNRDFASEHFAFYQELCAYLPPLAGKRVLELGCGKSYWLTLLLHSGGARATGIDTEVVEPGYAPTKYLGIWRRNGLERAARTLVWDVLFARPYYRELARVSGMRLDFAGIDVRAVSATALDLEPGSLDVVVSHEVFEHIDDVESVVRDLARLLKPDGITYIYVHNFASLSGGHHIAWKYPDTEPATEVPPWDHLRARRFPEIPSWLNEWREQQYRTVFERHLQVLDWIPRGTEGAALLTPEIRAELHDYSEDELLTKGFVVVARPRAAAVADVGTPAPRKHQGRRPVEDLA